MDIKNLDALVTKVKESETRSALISRVVDRLFTDAGIIGVNNTTLGLKIRGDQKDRLIELIREFQREEQKAIQADADTLKALNDLVGVRDGD